MLIYFPKQVALKILKGVFLDYLMKDQSKHVDFVKAPYPASAMHASDLKIRRMDILHRFS